MKKLSPVIAYFSLGLNAVVLARWLFVYTNYPYAGREARFNAGLPVTGNYLTALLLVLTIVSVVVLARRSGVGGKIVLVVQGVFLLLWGFQLL